MGRKFLFFYFFVVYKQEMQQLKKEYKTLESLNILLYLPSYRLIVDIFGHKKVFGFILRDKIW